MSASDRRPVRWLAVVVTAGLYLLCGYWLWTRSELLRGTLTVAAHSLGLALVAGTWVMLLKPWRHRWLLQHHGAEMTWCDALQDRLAMTALKTFVPWVIGDPYGYWLVGRRIELTHEKMAAVWLIDKGLTLVAVMIVALAAAAALVAPPFVAALTVPLLAVAVGELRLGSFGDYPRGLRLRLVGLALLQEALHLGGLVALLAPVVDGGLTSLRGYDVVLVHLSSMVPTLAGGAGSREAATLLVFADRGGARSLFVAGFAATLCLRALPALPGVLVFRRLRDRAELDE